MGYFGGFFASANWRNTMMKASREVYAKEFLDKAMNAISASLSRGMTPDYLFIDPKLGVQGIKEFCGMKVWIVPLPEDREIIAVAVQSSCQTTE